MEHQITMNLDLKDSGVMLEDILKHLSKAEKKKIAIAFVKEILDQPLGKERADLEQELVNEFMKEKQSSYGSNKDTPKYKNEDEVRAHYTFRNKLAALKSPRQVILEETFKSIEYDLKEYLKKEVESNDQVNKIVNALRDSFLENMTSYVQNAMTQWFTQQMSETIQTNYILEQRANMLESSLSDVLQRLELPPLPLIQGR